jgi:putative ABC transport system substrate-binding protein
MRRRDFISLVASAAAVWPLPSHAQQMDRVRRIGVLMPFSETDAEGKLELAGFAKQLQDLGWTDGRNLRIDYRWSAGNPERMQTLAKELTALQPDVLFSRSTPVTGALMKQTRTIPIVFAVVSDPVGEGFVASLARPGGNATGFTNAESSLTGKWLGLLKEIMPSINRVALIFDPKVAPGGGS